MFSVSIHTLLKVLAVCSFVFICHFQVYHFFSLSFQSHVFLIHLRFYMLTVWSRCIIGKLSVMVLQCLEKYFEMNKKNCREALDVYKKFLARMDRVCGFLKVAEVCEICFLYCVMSLMWFMPAWKILKMLELGFNTSSVGIHRGVWKVLKQSMN